MSYEMIDSGSGNGSGYVNIYLYPNDSDDDSMVENNYGTVGVAKLGAQEFGSQLASADIIDGYYVYRSYEHPNLPQYNPAINHFDNSVSPRWETYEGPNDRDQSGYYSEYQYPGIHLLVYNVSGGTTGVAESPATGRGGFDEQLDGAVAYDSGGSSNRAVNVVLQEIGHAFITTSEDSSGNEDDHRLGQIYPGWLGDGPVSPMATGYTSSMREGNCSNDAPHNLTFDRDLTSCAKTEVDNTENQ